MVLSKREKIIGALAAAIIAVPALNSLVISPITTKMAVLDADIGAATDELERTGRLFETSKAARREWAAMARAALVEDRPRAESQILNNVREWAQESGISLSSLKPEREEKEKDFQKITFRATCSGGMAQIGQFLHRIQTAAIPVRITDLQLSSQRDGTDELTLSVALATIYMPPESERSPLPARGASASAGDLWR